jgi:hypothetical protein
LAGKKCANIFWSKTHFRIRRLYQLRSRPDASRSHKRCITPHTRREVPITTIALQFPVCCSTCCSARICRRYGYAADTARPLHCTRSSPPDISPRR